MDLYRLQNALDLFDREVAQDVPLQTIRSFLVIAQKGDCFYKDVEREVGMTDASTTLSPAIPLKRNCGSTTAPVSTPIRQVPAGW